MTAEIILLIVITGLTATTIILMSLKQSNPGAGIGETIKETGNALLKFENSLERIERSMKDEFRGNREETHTVLKNQREELTKSLDGFRVAFDENTKKLNDLFEEKFNAFGAKQTEINLEAEKRIKDVNETVGKQLKEIREDNTKQLNEVRKTVDEKLQKTLNERLAQSFETVGKQLKSVQEGLGEMKNLAADVGGLKKVLSNVKMRGGIGEIQLSMLLEQILAPDQYEANVKTKHGSGQPLSSRSSCPEKTMTIPSLSANQIDRSCAGGVEYLC